jgi:hypothetical protein
MQKIKLVFFFISIFLALGLIIGIGAIVIAQTALPNSAPNNTIAVPQQTTTTLSAGSGGSAQSSASVSTTIAAPSQTSVATAQPLTISVSDLSAASQQISMVATSSASVSIGSVPSATSISEPASGLSPASSASGGGLAAPVNTQAQQGSSTIISQPATGNTSSVSVPQASPTNTAAPLPEKISPQEPYPSTLELPAATLGQKETLPSLPVASATNTITRIIPSSTSGGQQVSVEVKTPQASSVEFYLQTQESQTPVYLGQGKAVDEKTWQYQVNTENLPNASYKILPKIQNQQGEYQAGGTSLTVQNPKPETKQEELNITEKIQKIEKEIAQAKTASQAEAKSVQGVLLRQYQTLVQTAKNSIEEAKQNFIKQQRTAEVQKMETAGKELESRVKATEQVINANTEKLVDQAAVLVGIENRLQEKKQASQQLEQKAEILKEELEQWKAEPVSDPSLEAVLERHRQDKEDKLSYVLEEKTKTDEEIASLEKDITLKQQEKEELKMEMVATVQKTVAPVQEVLSTEPITPSIEAIENAANDTHLVLNEELQGLEITIAQQEKVKSAKVTLLTQDSDKDGLSDKEEIDLGTDPFNPDSDGDGFLDKIEKDFGFDPLKPSSALTITYEEPLKTKARISDVYKVSRVALFVATTTGQPQLKIEGKGLPNSFVTLYIYSAPVVLVVKTDENGNFVYSLDKTLEDGYHQVYVAVNNNEGKIVERSEVFSFLKTPAAVAAVAPPSLSSQLASPAESMNRFYSLFVAIAIVLALAVALLIIGVLIKRKEKNV